MGGIFGGGGGGAPIKTAAQLAAEQNSSAAQSRADERATSQERSEMRGVQNRRRLRRSGGMRMLFSQSRQEGPQQGQYTKLGGGE
tara:strand:- start:203 stop:457 length:255 start_codon:yes stop_codon:yes gene_type:complete